MKRIGGEEEAVDGTEQNRVSKKKFISAIAKRSGYPVRVVTSVYDATIAELLAVVSRGDQLMLTGFGRFYGQKHKGHRVQFADGQKRISDYFVLKFSATREINRKLGKGETPVVEPVAASTEE